MQTALKRLKIGPYGLWAIAIIIVDAIMRIVLIAQGWPETNSDEGTMGLEAMHIAFRGEHPTFLYGQNYMGMVEAYLGAALFRLFGVSLFNLRLGMIILFTLFLIAIYLFTTLLYSKKLALLVLALLSVGTQTTLMTEMLAVGGVVETLLFGTLLMLLASWLALTFVYDEMPRKQRWRYVVYGAWGLTAGIGLYSHTLILPFIVMSGLILLVFCHYELRRWALLCLVAGFLIGAAPLIVYNVTAPVGQNSLDVLQQLRRLDANSVDAPHGLLLLVKELLGTFLYSLPVATNLSPVCSLSDLPLFGPTTSNTATCSIVQGGWSLGYMTLLLSALFLSLRGIRPLWIQWVQWIQRLTRRSAAAVTPTASIEERQHTIIEFAHLMLLLSAATTIILFVTNPVAAVRPWSTRYLIGLLIALPAVLWPLWHGMRTTVQNWNMENHDGRSQEFPSEPILEYDGHPQALPAPKQVPDRHPQALPALMQEPDGRPQALPALMQEPDGRPQGAPPIHPTSPVPTMYGRARSAWAFPGYRRSKGGEGKALVVARLSSSARFALAFRSSIVVLISAVFLIGTIAVFTLVPGAQALNQQDNVLIHDLAQAGVTHMYSDYWTCDRLIFLTQEHLTCGVVNIATTGPGLNRYTPYYTTVQADPHSAYVFVADSVYANAFAQRIATSRTQYHKLLFVGYVVYVPLLTWQIPPHTLQSPTTVGVRFSAPNSTSEAMSSLL